MTYNKKTNTLTTAGVYIDIMPTQPNGYVASVSTSLYNKLKKGVVVKWNNKSDLPILWDLLITRKSHNKVWFYLPQEGLNYGKQKIQLLSLY